MSTVLVAGARALGFELDARQIELFDRYAVILLAEGRRFGVTAIATRERIERRHFVESLAIGKALLDAGILDLVLESSVVDVGTGGGLPGLPIKIALPEVRLTLLDARLRTVAFLGELLGELGIDGVEVVTARAEDAGRDPTHRERFDVALARALAPLPVLLELTLPLLRVGGHMATLKGSGAEEELEQSAHALVLLDGEIVSSDPLFAPGEVHKQRLIVVRKTASTDGRYPRRAGIPKKRPL